MDPQNLMIAIAGPPGSNTGWQAGQLANMWPAALGLSGGLRQMDAHRGIELPAGFRGDEAADLSDDRPRYWAGVQTILAWVQPRVPVVLADAFIAGNELERCHLACHGWHLGGIFWINAAPNQILASLADRPPDFDARWLQYDQQTAPLLRGLYRAGMVTQVQWDPVMGRLQEAIRRAVARGDI